jgi:ABC-type proline/glycine betaine transport system permease subunit
MDLLYIIVNVWKQDEEFWFLIILLFEIIVAGCMFYMIEQGWGIIDPIYFCVKTISTFGYSDFSSTTLALKIFTIALALSGIGVFVGIVTKLAQSLAQKVIEK